jgi:drug/metabolite transporter (DMT)-like permease
LKRLAFLTALTMLAFAANSLLNRLALEGGAAGPASFALIRLVAGAAVLGALVIGRGDGWPGLRASMSGRGAAALAVYVLGFSFAYVSLNAGVGALILFGGVQVTMFAGALVSREVVPPWRWAGAAISLAGLGWLMWPAGGAAPDLAGAGLMAAAALGWGLYSLIGRGARDPAAATAANFMLAVPAGVVAWLLFPDRIGVTGAVLAVISGGVTSGLGYALWYRLLPELGASRAAVAQLSVPVIALAGGVIMLGEAVSLRIVLASALVLGGVGLSLVRR